MAFHRDLTPDELQQLVDEALSQLADAVNEFKNARLKKAAKEPNEELARQRLMLAHESVLACLDTYERIKAQWRRSQ
jgi:hypothetical protein